VTNRRAFVDVRELDHCKQLPAEHLYTAPRALWTMFVIVLIGMPWTFRCRLELGERNN